MKKLIVANWKNHPDTLAEAEQILDSVDEYLASLETEEFSLVFCPPFVFTEEVGKILGTSHLIHQAELGAQDISTDDNTALTPHQADPLTAVKKGGGLGTGQAGTGEISGLMLKNLGVRYVIIGHSERRWKIGESDEVVNQKLKAVLRNEMVPIVCVGERVRDENFKEFLNGQVIATFAGLSPDEISRCIIAYEPVWAISTTPDSRPDTPQNALESIKIIQDTLVSNLEIRASDLNFLYGGSVNSGNVSDFLSQKEINGVLVGGASVNKEEFVKILAIASKIKSVS